MLCRSVTGSCLVVAVALAALSSTRAAGAASPDARAAARQHYNQADKLKKQGQLAEACKHLEEVERLDPKLPTLIELAECTEQVGNVVAAQTWWALARDRAKRDEKPQSRARAESRLAAVQKRVAQLTLKLPPNAPPGVQVLSDGSALEPASLAAAVPMNPGDHVIVVKLAGHDDAKFNVKLADGDNQSLAIAPGPTTTAGAPAVAPLPTPGLAPAPAAAAAPAAPPAAAVKVAAPKAGWWSTEHTAGVILGAVGVAALGGGTALCLAANGAEGGGASGDSRWALGGISLATGGVMLVSGLLLLASSSAEEAPPHAGVRFQPTLVVTQNRAVFGALGEF
jgi:hypothetical protein